MAELVGLCNQSWNETLFDGSQIISCPSDKFQLLPPADAVSQPDFFNYTSPVATCATGFSQVVSGANHQLICSGSDFAFISRSDFFSAVPPVEDGSMNPAQFESLWLLVFIIGLVMAFGLGAIHGGAALMDSIPLVVSSLFAAYAIGWSWAASVTYFKQFMEKST
ncbi:MAG: hypothetical protein IBX50_12645 [Marinospirillum sp.]|uniref:tail virion protein G7P-2 n=1 Tax=Marinospirillum sp. TaxID=2183934 RepID=UPI0019F81E05|nr:tail virion protein G7P-2 [Marinospirillum sp.]MBE0507544.1 hypothetical protein [Marinospirillum sp.]